MRLRNRSGWTLIVTILTGASASCSSSSHGDAVSAGATGGTATEIGGSDDASGGRGGDAATGGTGGDASGGRAGDAGGGDASGARGGGNASGGSAGGVAAGGDDSSGGRAGGVAAGGDGTSGGRGGDDAIGGSAGEELTGGTAGDAGGTAGATVTGGSGGEASADEEGEVFDCESSPGVNVDPEAVGTVTGTNGTLTDTCDENGNLLEYECETTLMCDGVPNPACWNEYPGSVVPREIDCGGECVAGTCARDCPDIGDSVTFQAFETDGAATIEKDGRLYQCELLFDRADDGIDCATEYSLDETVEIVSIGITDSLCTTGRFNFGLGPCSWGCQRVPR